jgi:DNA-binding transcriptional ArsR family regulator
MLTGVVEAVWSVLADPTRRSVLGLLLDRPRAVGELVDALGLTQPTTSKHLRVLRDVGFVQVTGDGRRRIYSIDPAPLAEVDAWLDPYRRLWAEPLDALGRHLDTMKERER